jgi:hypothetical protein
VSRADLRARSLVRRSLAWRLAAVGRVAGARLSLTGGGTLPGTTRQPQGPRYSARLSTSPAKRALACECSQVDRVADQGSRGRNLRRHALLVELVGIAKNTAERSWWLAKWAGTPAARFKLSQPARMAAAGLRISLANRKVEGRRQARPIRSTSASLGAASGSFTPNLKSDQPIPKSAGRFRNRRAPLPVRRRQDVVNR